jgi:hypothetical protein
MAQSEAFGPVDGDLARAEPKRLRYRLLHTAARAGGPPLGLAPLSLQHGRAAGGFSLTASGFPYFRAPWGGNVAAAILGDHTDWTEIAELVTDSYCEMAPKFLIARLTPRPGI